MAEGTIGAEELTRLMDRYGDDLLRTAALYLGDPALAEDAVQETFLKVCRHYQRYQPLEREKAWLLTVCLNTCRNLRRGAWFRLVNRRLALEDIPEPGAEMRPCDDTVLQAVMGLPGKYREALLLYYWQGLKTREIAQALRVPESTVSVRLKRARERLKPMLEGWYCDEE